MHIQEREQHRWNIKKPPTLRRNRKRFEIFQLIFHMSAVSFTNSMTFSSLKSFSVRGFVRFEHPWPLEPSKTMDSIEWNMPANQSIVNIFISKRMQ